MKSTCQRQPRKQQATNFKILIRKAHLSIWLVWAKKNLNANDICICQYNYQFVLYNNICILLSNTISIPLKRVVILIQGNISPRLIFILSPSLSAGELRTGRIPMSHIISFFKTPPCLGEFKTGQNRSQVKKSENKTGENNPVYSRFIIIIHKSCSFDYKDIKTFTVVYLHLPTIP